MEIDVRGLDGYLRQQDMKEIFDISFIYSCLSLDEDFLRKLDILSTFMSVRIPNLGKCKQSPIIALETKF